MLLLIYAAAAILLAPLIFVTAEWIGHDGRPLRRHQVWYSMLAALLWPVLAVGLAQFAVIHAARHALRPRDRLLLVDQDESDTARLRIAGPYLGVGTPAT